MTRRIISALAAAVFGMTLVVQASGETKNTLRFSTLAPQNSSWGKVFKVWEDAVVKKTKGRLKLDVYYNGVQGLEDSMVAKMKTGQLDGAALSALGLSRIDQNVMAMTLPWVIDSWKKLDKVRPHIAPRFEKKFSEGGFELLGWGDIGLVYGFSKGSFPERPEQVRGRRPQVWRNEPVGPIVYSIIGQVTPVPLSSTEVLPALQSGNIDMISAPALAAEQLQWVPHLDHVTAEPIVTAIGATVFRKKSLAQLDPDVRELFLKMQKRVAKSQNQRIRKLDMGAYARIKKRMTVVKVEGADKEAWKAVSRKALKRLSQGVFPRDLMKKVADLAGYKGLDI